MCKQIEATIASQPTLDRVKDGTTDWGAICQSTCTLCMYTYMSSNSKSKLTFCRKEGGNHVPSCLSRVFLMILRKCCLREVAFHSPFVSGLDILTILCMCAEFETTMTMNTRSSRRRLLEQ